MKRSDDDKLSQTFAALANSTRRAILARLAEGEATVNELAEPFKTLDFAIDKGFAWFREPQRNIGGLRRRSGHRAVDRGAA